MILDILYFLSCKAYDATLMARTRRGRYGFGGHAYTGGKTSRLGEWS